jgi:hypothetical protein
MEQYLPIAIDGKAVFVAPVICCVRATSGVRELRFLDGSLGEEGSAD